MINSFPRPTSNGDSSSPKLFVQANDPSTAAKTNDIWVDTVNNIQWRRLAGAWEQIGATYN